MNKRKQKEFNLEETIAEIAKYNGMTIEQTKQLIKQMLSNGKMPMALWSALEKEESEAK